MAACTASTTRPVDVNSWQIDATLFTGHHSNPRPPPIARSSGLISTSAPSVADVTAAVYTGWCLMCNKNMNRWDVSYLVIFVVKHLSLRFFPHVHTDSLISL